MYIYIADYQLYEGIWIRASDGAKITCHLRFDGKLKCNWEEGGPSNVLEITKSSLVWDKYGAITGAYNDESIAWTNGSIWVKQGKFIKVSVS